VIETAAAEGAALQAAQRQAASAASAQACSGQLSVVVRQTPQRRSLSFLDAQTGEPKDIEVLWRSSHQLTVERERSRPCGYLIGPQQMTAVRRLRALGIEVLTLGHEPNPQAWELEDYVVQADAAGQRQDARGAIADATASLRVLRVQTQARQAVPAPGSHYVPMNQALAGLVSAALEPDSQDSFAANRLLNLEDSQLRRVVRPPPLAGTANKAP
jgi:hypothetical protein